MAGMCAQRNFQTSCVLQMSFVRFTSSAPRGGIRLNRLMAMKGICSRREADDFIKAGFVEVDGRSAILGEVIDENMIDRSVHIGEETAMHLSRS